MIQNSDAVDTGMQSSGGAQRNNCGYIFLTFLIIQLEKVNLFDFQFSLQKQRIFLPGTRIHAPYRIAGL
jgi:hypothetical protein